MASLHKDPRKKSPYWYCAYTDQNGKRCFKSTKAKDLKQAEQICQSWTKAVNHAKTGKLNLDQARKIIAAGVSDVLAASGQAMPSRTIRNWFKAWLEAKEVENEPSTHEKYKQASDDFIAHLQKKADRDLDQLESDDVLGFRDSCMKRLSISSVNGHLKSLRVCLNSALQQGLIQRNVATQVKKLKESDTPSRRPFTPAELQRVLVACKDTHWRGLVLLGVYTGQRIGDCARIKWEQIDLVGRRISFRTKKTKHALEMALAEPLLDYLSGLPSSDDAGTFVFADLAGMASGKNVSPLSNSFALDVLIPAGLMPKRNEKKKSEGKGRRGKRKVNEVTFHSLRHNFTTMLKAAGGSNSMAQSIVGHKSSAVSAHYTHLGADDTAALISKLPDVTKAGPKT
jgi:integrase